MDKRLNNGSLNVVSQSDCLIMQVRIGQSLAFELAKTCALVYTTVVVADAS